MSFPREFQIALLSVLVGVIGWASVEKLRTTAVEADVKARLEQIREEQKEQRTEMRQLREAVEKALADRRR